MSDTNIVQEAIKELPPAERVIAVALKNIFDQVKQLAVKEKDEINQNHTKYLEIFKDIENRANLVVQGKQLTKADLEGQDNYFTQAEEADKLKIMASKAPLKDYWLQVLLNCQLGCQLSPIDKEIANYITRLSSNVTEDAMEVTIAIKDNTVVSSGTFTRRLILSEGLPMKIEGDQVQLLKKDAKDQGILDALLCNNTDSELIVNTAFEIISTLINQVIPYSLEGFLGIMDIDEDDEGEDDDEEEEDESVSKKKTKE